MSFMEDLNNASSSQIIMMVEFDRELSAEELDRVVVEVTARMQDRGVVEDLPVGNVSPVRVVGGAMVPVHPDAPGPPEPPPLRGI